MFRIVILLLLLHFKFNLLLIMGDIEKAYEFDHLNVFIYENQLSLLVVINPVRV